jgi:hypothetical protein
MLRPRHPDDPCFHWKEYRLERTAAAMRLGNFGIPKPKLSDTQKIQVAMLLVERFNTPPEYFAVWIDAGCLRVRYGLQGPPCHLSWLHACRLTDFFEKPVFRKTLAVAHVAWRKDRSA